MTALRAACGYVIEQLDERDALAEGMRPQIAGDILRTLISVQVRDQLTNDKGWSKKQYQRELRALVHRAVTSGSHRERTIIRQSSQSDTVDI